MKLVFATGNPGKIREASAILSGYEIISPRDLGIFDEPEETGETFRENSLIKAEALWKATGLPCFADDSGLCVDALGGAPGVHSARYASESHDFDANIAKLLSALEGVEDRKAHFCCVATLILDGKPVFFEGRCDGRISTERYGRGGFGYDPVFIPDESPDGKTFAELGEDFKNAIAHRGKALRAMSAWLSEL